MIDSKKTRLGSAWETQMPENWKQLLQEEWCNPRFRDLAWFLETEYENQEILPDSDLLFTAFRLTPFDLVKVVILGQDPYHNPQYPHGLAFSVPPGTRIPVSLRNIFKEMATDLDVPIRDGGCLIDWAEQGVLLLNTCLTVRTGEPGSHSGHGWEVLTDRIIRLLSELKTNLVFILWGSHAIAKSPLIDKEKHLLICSSHPSHFSFERWCQESPPFKGSRPFSRTNAYLKDHEFPEIQWSDNP